MLKQMFYTFAGAECVIFVHQIRARKMAAKFIMDARLFVHPKIIVSEGRRIGDAVEFSLHQRFKELTGFTMHIDREGDAMPPNLHYTVLKGLSQVLSEQEVELKDLGKDDFANIKNHYIDG